MKRLLSLFLSYVACDQINDTPYLVQYENGIEIATFPASPTIKYDDMNLHRRLDAIQTANNTLNQANTIFLAVINMGENLKKNIDTVLADLTAIQATGLTLDRGNKTLQDAQLVIQNGLLLTTQVQSLFTYTTPQNATPIQNDPSNVVADVMTTKRALENLIQDIQAIGTSGLSVVTASKAISDLQVAVQVGLVAAKDGVDIINSIQQVVAGGISIQEGQTITKAIQVVVEKGLASFDSAPKVCRRRATFRGGASPLVNLCLATEDTLGPLCLPKCKPGYEPVGFDSCRKIGCSGVPGVSDLGTWCTKPASYERSGYAIWDQAKCKRERGDCEQCALVWYPKCRPGYHSFGCFICMPDCPAGSIDDIAFCRKDSYFRGVSASRLGCPPGKDQSLLLCYPRCAPTEDGAGPLCSPKCSGNTPVNCGIFCTSSEATCASSVVELVGTGVYMALSAIANDYTGVLSSAIKLGSQVINTAPCT